MSKIFDALKRAELSRNSGGRYRLSANDLSENTERRRGKRFGLDIPVYIYGHGPGTEPFHEEAHTLNVSASGALLLLSVPVTPGQQLLVTNTFTDQEQACRVIFLGTRRTKTVEAGVAFIDANPGFWPIPAEPKPASR